MLMLDADAVVGWEARRFDLPAFLKKRGSESVAISAIAWQQLWAGAEHFEPGRVARRRRHLLHLYPYLKVVEFETAQARQAATLDAMLRAAGEQIGYADVLIASAAITKGAELLTFNRSEFERTGVILAEV